MLDIDISIASDGWRTDLPAAEAVAREPAAATFARAGLPAGAWLEVSVLLADDETVRGLNRDYRGRDAATNVLSFPSEAPGEAWAAAAAARERPAPLGDVVLAHGTVAREAEAQGKTLGSHASHLLVHGFLHLLGYDHESDRDADAMERLEVAILAGLGIADPYRTDAAPAQRKTEAET